MQSNNRSYNFGLLRSRRKDETPGQQANVALKKVYCIRGGMSQNHIDHTQPVHYLDHVQAKSATPYSTRSMTSVPSFVTPHQLSSLFQVDSSSLSSTHTEVREIMRQPAKSLVIRSESSSLNSSPKYPEFPTIGQTRPTVNTPNENNWKKFFTKSKDKNGNTSMNSSSSSSSSDKDKDRENADRKKSKSGDKSSSPSSSISSPDLAEAADQSTTILPALTSAGGINSKGMK